jgi:hypothetical protein
MKRLENATVYDVAQMFEISVTGDVAGVITLPKQIKFAGAKSLNDTGRQSTTDAGEEFKRELHIRRDWIRPKTRFGINIVQAKFAAPIPEAVIFTRADWLLEEEGFNRGVKEPDKGGEHLAIPEDENIRGSITNVVPAARKARRLLAGSQGRVSLKTGKLIGKTGAFILNAKDGRTFIFQRIGTDAQGEIKKNKKGVPLRGRVRRGASQLILLYTFKKHVTVPRLYILQKSVENTYKVHYADYFSINLSGALRGAKI